MHPVRWRQGLEQNLYQRYLFQHLLDDFRSLPDHLSLRDWSGLVYQLYAVQSLLEHAGEDRLVTYSIFAIF